jgi:uncharacterized protein
MKKLVLFASLCGAAVFGSAQAQAQGFSCANATTPAEITICGSPELRRLDEKMAAQYYSIRNALDDEPQDKAKLAAEQRHWMAQRNRCGFNPVCIRAAYIARLPELVGWDGDE